MANNFELKLGNMRKSQEFSALKQGDKIIIQSDKSTGMLDVNTGKFIFTNKSCYPAYLSAYGKPLELTEEQKKLIIDSCYQKGDTLPGGFITIG
jgi:hypothetical protein